MTRSESILRIIPSISPEEFAYLEAFTEDLPADKLNFFLGVYNGKRQKPDTILLCTVLGFVGFSGIQRFITGQIGMGILFFLTGGLCLIGTIVDLVNHRNLAFEFNQRMSLEAMRMIKGSH